MRIPLSVLTGVFSLLLMFFLMVECNNLCFETYSAWHCYTQSVDALEEYGQTKKRMNQVIENGKKKGYEISITKKGDMSLVVLEYHAKIPVLSIDVKQRITGYAH
ncbi:MAG: hypothetical protein MJ087_05280 [Lachnospiraceae bacterium]|nr:hypothetical protein [Lachnospiraceae bacterium]